MAIKLDRVVDFRGGGNAPSTRTISPGAESAVGRSISSLGNVAQLAGAIGQQVANKREQQKLHDEKRYRRRALLDTKQRMQDADVAVSSSFGEDTQGAYNNWIDTADGLPDYTGTKAVDSMGDLGKRVSGRGYSEGLKELIALDREEYLLGRDTTHRLHIVDEQRTVDLNDIEQVRNQSVQDLAAGRSTLDDEKERLFNAYNDARHMSPGDKEKFYNQDVQTVTQTLLDTAINSKDAVVMQKILDGKFDDELGTGKTGRKLIDSYKDQAEKVLSDLNVTRATVEHDVDQYGRNYNEFRDAVNKDDSLNDDEKDSVLKNGQVEITRRNTADTKAKALNKTEEANTYSNLLADGKNDEAMKYARDLKLNPQSGHEDSEINKWISDNAKGVDPYKQTDPDMVKIIEDHFVFLDENPTQVDMGKFYTVIQNAWGKGEKGGINETQYKGFMTRWRTIDEAGDKKADPLNDDAYKFSSKELDTFYKDGGYATEEEAQRSINVTDAVFFGDLSEEEQVALEKQVAEDDRQQKRMMQEDRENLKSETLAGKDPKEYFDKNVKPRIDTKKEEDVKGWLDDFFGLFRFDQTGLVEQEIRRGVARETELSQEDLEFTAKKHGITVDEVKKRLRK